MSRGNEPRLRRLFAQEAQGRISGLIDAVRAIESAGDAPEALARMSREAHALHRGAGVVGLPEVHDLAGALKDLVTALGAPPSIPAAADVDLVLMAAEGLRVLLGLAPGPEVDAKELAERLARRAHATSRGDAPSRTPLLPADRPRRGPAHHNEDPTRPPPGERSGPPETLSCLVLRAGGQSFGLPLSSVERVAALDDESLAGHERLVRPLTGVLGLPGVTPSAVVVVRGHGQRAAFGVEGILGLREFVVQALGGPAPAGPVIAGAAVHDAGRVLVILDADGLVRAGVGDAEMERAP